MIHIQFESLSRAYLAYLCHFSLLYSPTLNLVVSSDANPEGLDVELVWVISELLVAVASVENRTSTSTAGQARCEETFDETRKSQMNKSDLERIVM
jgi:hypothetical protein